MFMNIRRITAHFCIFYAMYAMDKWGIDPENVPKEEVAFKKVEDERVRADCNFRKVCD